MQQCTHDHDSIYSKLGHTHSSDEVLYPDWITDVATPLYTYNDGIIYSVYNNNTTTGTKVGTWSAISTNGYTLMTTTITTAVSNTSSSSYSINFYPASGDSRRIGILGDSSLTRISGSTFTYYSGGCVNVLKGAAYFIHMFQPSGNTTYNAAIGTATFIITGALFAR